MARPCGGCLDAIPRRLRSVLLRPMQSITQTERHAAFLEALYLLSGRDVPSHPLHGSTAGLWEDFALGLAARLRDSDYEELVQRGAKAITAAESHVAERQAAAVIEVVRNYLLAPWEGGHTS